MSKLKLTVFLLFFISFNSFAQEIVISEADVDRFVNSFLPIMSEMKKMQQEMEAVENPTPELMLQAREKLNNVLQEYGWGTEYQDKANAITALYGLTLAKKEANDREDGYKAAMLEALKAQENQMAERYGSQSIANVVAKFDELDSVFKQIE